MTKGQVAIVVFLLGAEGACERSAPESPAARPGSSGRTLGPAAPDRDGVLKVLVYHDMEGLAGQSDWRTFEYRHREFYLRGQEMLVADVNAVIDGLFVGGAKVVHVVDAHGSGNPEPDILLDRLDPRAQLVLRDKPFRPYVDLVEKDAYDAVAVVGMHAKTGSRGFASHTFTLGMDIIFNEQSITETELIGYSWGRVGVPVIFGSGDDRLAHDLETMPWIKFVTVKKATSASTAEPRPVEEVHREMREAARRALAERDQTQVMQLTPPIRAALRVVPPASLELLKGVPGIDYREERVTFNARDLLEAYDGVVALIDVASVGYHQVLEETVRSQPGAQALRWEFEERLMNRWMDYESGRWSPSRPEAPARPRYHGAR